MKHKIVRRIAFSCLLLFISSCEKQAPETVPVAYTAAAAVEREAADSLFTNNRYARNLLRKSLKVTRDSIAYYRLMGVYASACFASSDFDSVLYYTAKVKSYGNRAPASPYLNNVLSRSNSLIGNVWLQRSQPDSGIVYYRKAYEYLMQAKDLSSLPDLCINLADANHLGGNLTEDVRYYRRALFLCDSLSLPEIQKFPIYIGLGQAYMELRDFELSDQYFEMGGRFFPQLSPYEKFNYLTLRTNHFYYKKDYLRAGYYNGWCLRTLEGYPQMIFERHLSMANQGELFMLSNKLDSAQIFLNECSHYFSHVVQNATALYYIETQMIELAIRQGDLARATEMIARTRSNSYVDPNVLGIRNRYLEHYYVRTGDYRRAYECQIRNQELDDSVRNERVLSRVAELDMRYRQDTILMRRELVITRQSGEVKALRLTSFLWAGGFLAVLVAAGLIYWIMKKKRFFIQQHLLSQIGRLRMMNIRNHVSPHFTFNVLNREISHFKGSEDAHNGLLDLVSLLRKSLELAEKLCVPVLEELNFVQIYLNLERSRLDDDFVLTLHVDESLDAEHFLIPSLIIQIPVENAIKHGLPGAEGDQQLGISVTCEGGGIRILVTDNGSGYQPGLGVSEGGTGTGLKVLYRTIQLLNAHNRGDKIQFDIINLANSGGTGTCVSVYIPGHYNYDL